MTYEHGSWKVTIYYNRIHSQYRWSVFYLSEKIATGFSVLDHSHALHMATNAIEKHKQTLTNFLLAVQSDCQPTSKEVK